MSRLKVVSLRALVLAALLAPLVAWADVAVDFSRYSSPSFPDIANIGVHRLAAVFFLIVFALGVCVNLLQRRTRGSKVLGYLEIAFAAILNAYFWAMICVSETWQNAVAAFLVVSVPFLSVCLFLTWIMRKLLRRPAMTPQIKTEVALVFIAMGLLFFAASLLLAYGVK